MDYKLGGNRDVKPYIIGHETDNMGKQYPIYKPHELKKYGIEFYVRLNKKVTHTKIRIESDSIVELAWILIKYRLKLSR